MTDYSGTIKLALEKLYADISDAREDSRFADIVGRGASGDITLAIDAVAEKSLIDSIREAIPDCTVVSEEVGIVGGGQDAPIALIDPIDGSTNAIRGIPVFAGVIGILEGRKFRTMKAAGIIDLVTGETIIGDESGVLVNGRMWKPSEVSALSEALVCYELKVRVKRPKEIMEKMHALITRTKYPRVLGSAAIEIAYVAIGRIDAYVSPGKQLRNYDCLPSVFMVKNAGGFVRGVGQNLDNIDVLSKERVSFVVAGNEKLGKSIAAEFQ